MQEGLSLYSCTYLDGNEPLRRSLGCRALHDSDYSEGTRKGRPFRLTCIAVKGYAVWWGSSWILSHMEAIFPTHMGFKEKTPTIWYSINFQSGHSLHIVYIWCSIECTQQHIINEGYKYTAVFLSLCVWVTSAWSRAPYHFTVPHEPWWYEPLGNYLTHACTCPHICTLILWLFMQKNSQSLPLQKRHFLFLYCSLSAKISTHGVLFPETLPPNFEWLLFLRPSNKQMKQSRFWIQIAAAFLQGWISYQPWSPPPSMLTGLRPASCSKLKASMRGYSWLLFGQLTHRIQTGSYICFAYRFLCSAQSYWSFNSEWEVNIWQYWYLTRALYSVKLFVNTLYKLVFVTLYSILYSVWNMHKRIDSSVQANVGN